jgi:GT2 family glycosyltransferase
VPEAPLPAFDLVLATVDRVDEPAAFLASLERQTHRSFRVLVVDQNDDDRLQPILDAHPAVETLRLRSGRGLSRARNGALPHVTADVVAFPDDDCVYPDDLLERLGRRLTARPELDGVTVRAVDRSGRSSPSWEREAAVLTADNLWNRAVSFALFLRRRIVAEVGEFDEQLGLGAQTPWFSSEEIDYLVRAVRAGARIEYDPALTVIHEEKVSQDGAPAAVGHRDGASIGYILRKHGYPPAVIARMLVRPLGGAVVSAARGDVTRARFHAATLRGRLLGYRRAGRLHGS